MVDLIGAVGVGIPDGGSVEVGGSSLLSLKLSGKLGIRERAIDKTSLGLDMAGAFATGVHSL